MCIRQCVPSLRTTCGTPKHSRFVVATRRSTRHRTGAKQKNAYHERHGERSRVNGKMMTRDKRLKTVYVPCPASSSASALRCAAVAPGPGRKGARENTRARCVPLSLRPSIVNAGTRARRGGSCKYLERWQHLHPIALRHGLQTECIFSSPVRMRTRQKGCHDSRW